MAVLLAIILFVLGLVSGLLFKGINISITHKQEQKPEKPTYNESLVDLLPNNVKQYYHENNGQNRY